MGNQTELNELRIHGISVLEIGYQILPKCFYYFFEDKRQVIRRKIDSRETTLHIKSVISEYLESLRLTTLLASL